MKSVVYLVVITQECNESMVDIRCDFEMEPIKEKFDPFLETPLGPMYLYRVSTLAAIHMKISEGSIFSGYGDNLRIN